jgi:hypothetical protein
LISAGIGSHRSSTETGDARLGVSRGPLFGGSFERGCPGGAGGREALVTLVMILSIMMSYLLMMKVVAVTDGRGTGSETLSQ